MMYDDRTEYPDATLTQEIRDLREAIREVTRNGLAIIMGEGRRAEFTKDGLPAMRADLRDMEAAARRRGLSIGGRPGHAIGVEVG